MNLKVSIIIPIHNKADYTIKCLDSLIKTTNYSPYEIIIVDDASTDDSIARLHTGNYPVKIISNSKNSGYAISCNKGAAQAIGEYLLFLNNDTVCLENWLTEMITVMESYPKAGIVGSKLLYPDGSIQHAGVAFSPKKIPHHIFRTLAQDDPAVNITRAFQAVTAACLLITRNNFYRFGCFDETYENGLEDIDLCFKARKEGYQVVYAHKSVLYHLEGQSRNERVLSSFAQNLEHFQQRWAEQIIVDENIIAGKFHYRFVRDILGHGCLMTDELIEIIKNNLLDDQAHTHTHDIPDTLIELVRESELIEFIKKNCLDDHANKHNIPKQLIDLIKGSC
jgi:GT2 family glycosyltransferase